MLLTLSISSEGGDEPVHIGLGKWTGGLDEEVGKEGRWIQRVVPIDSARIMGVELDLHDDRPDIDAEVQKDYGVETKLGPPSLA